jgi:hypothetical protein
MSTYINTITERVRRLDARQVLVLSLGCVIVAFVTWVAIAHGAAILQGAFSSQTKGINGTSGAGGFDLFSTVNKLLGPALWIVLGLAPLAFAWGAGAMLFNGRHGGQAMGGAIIAVVLVAAAKGIAL